MCPEITANFWGVYGYMVCSIFCKREFEAFQICHPSHTDKLFGQLKEGHTHTLPVTGVQPFVPQHLSVLFYCCVCQQAREMMRSQPFVSVCAFMDVLMFLHCVHLVLQGISIFLTLMGSWTCSSLMSILIYIHSQTPEVDRVIRFFTSVKVLITHRKNTRYYIENVT